jgi:hypothetical protein
LIDPVPLLDPFTPRSSRTLVVQLDRLSDPQTLWTAHRLGITGILPTGERSHFFVRAGYLAFFTSDLPVLARWPWLAGAESSEGWPFERRIVGFVRPELGLSGDFGLPGLGRGQFGLALALPVGRDELYPFTAASLPVQIQWSFPVRIGSALVLRLGGGLFQQFDSGKEYLQPEAFPSGYQGNATLFWQLGERRSVEVSIHNHHLDQNQSTTVALRIWLPTSGPNAFGLAWVQELAGQAGRAFATHLSLAWRVGPVPTAKVAEGDE